MSINDELLPNAAAAEALSPTIWAARGLEPSNEPKRTHRRSGSNKPNRTHRRSGSNSGTELSTTPTRSRRSSEADTSLYKLRQMLQQACRRGDVALARAVFRRSARASVPLSLNADLGIGGGAPAAWWAAYNANPMLLQVLIREGGADPNAKDGDGCSVLWAAVASGCATTVLSVLACGPHVDPDAAPTRGGHRGQGPLFLAIIRGKPQVVSALLLSPPPPPAAAGDRREAAHTFRRIPP